MSTIVYQEVQICLEACLSEPLVFKHKFAPLKQNPSPQNDKNKENENEYINKNKSKNKESFGGWSFLQSLTTPQTNPGKVFVHPLFKPSSTTLSKQSLDICTESLGSETGNFFTQSSHELSSLSSMREKDRSVRPSRPTVLAKKLRSRTYPPPLSSSYIVQVRSHREKGRLVIRATTKISQNDYFQTERRNGRLKLSLLKEKLYTESEEEEHGNGDIEWIEGVGRNSGNVGAQIENKPSRCKGERSAKSGIPFWGPFLVATS